jgi:dUTP pyrophosphatase
MKLLIEKMNDKVLTPTKGFGSDSGFDVYVHSIKKLFIAGAGNDEIVCDTEEKISKYINPLDDTLELPFASRVLIGTGLKATIGEGYEIQARTRSGNALNKGLIVVNSPGTIDESFRGEVGIIILNTSRKTQKILIGDKIAQLVPMAVPEVELEEVKTLPESKFSRGDGGFGSTDKLDRRGREIK